MTSTMNRGEMTARRTAKIADSSDMVQAVGAFLLRYGLVFVIVWIGFMKFTAYEAAGIQPWWPTARS